MNLSMDKMWKMIAEDGDIDAFYSILAQHPYVLDRIDQIPIVETPLHVAASAGKTRLAMEIATLKPSFARKLNPLGFSPMHLALQNGHDQTVRALVKIDNELVRVKAKGRVTLLHCAAGMGNVDLLAEFLSVCPSCIEDLTVQLETAVHVAVKNSKFRAFKVLLGWLQWFSDKQEILEWMDDEGNTALHIAASTNQPEVMKLLIKKVNINAKNLAGLTVNDIFHLQRDTLDREVGNILQLHVKAKSASEITKPTLTLAQRFTLGLSFWEKLQENFSIAVRRGPRKYPNDVRNVILVVAILIATATYQASLNPPGGYWQDNFNPPPRTNTTTSNNIDQGGQQNPHRAGKMILNPFHISLFFLSNTAAFYLSGFIILKLITGLPYFHILYVSSICLLYAYKLSMLLTFPSDSSAWTLLFLVSTAIGSLITVAALLIPLIVISFGRCPNSVEKLKSALGYLD